MNARSVRFESNGARCYIWKLQWNRVLTSHRQCRNRFQPLALRHRSVPHDARKLRTIILSAWDNGQCAGRLHVTRSSIDQIGGQWCCTSFTVPAANIDKVAKGSGIFLSSWMTHWIFILKLTKWWDPGSHPHCYRWVPAFCLPWRSFRCPEILAEAVAA